MLHNVHSRYLNLPSSIEGCAVVLCVHFVAEKKVFNWLPIGVIYRHAISKAANWITEKLACASIWVSCSSSKLKIIGNGKFQFSLLTRVHISQRDFYFLSRWISHPEGIEKKRMNAKAPPTRTAALRWSDSFIHSSASKQEGKGRDSVEPRNQFNYELPFIGAHCYKCSSNSSQAIIACAVSQLAAARARQWMRKSRLRGWWVSKITLEFWST